MRRELLFLLELFCFLFKQGILLKFIHFQLYIQNKKLTLFVIPGLPSILTSLYFVLYGFTNILRFFVILRCVVTWIIERLDRKLTSQGLISYRHRRLVVSCSKMALDGFVIVKILCDETMAKMWGKPVEKQGLFACMLFFSEVFTATLIFGVCFPFVCCLTAMATLQSHT